MANVDIQARHELHTRLDEVLGKKHAETMMSSVLPDWNQLATKDDLALLQADLTIVKADVAAVRSDLQSELVTVKSDLQSELATMGSDLRSEFYQAMNAQTWRLLGGVAVISTVTTSLVTVIGTALG